MNAAFSLFGFLGAGFVGACLTFLWNARRSAARRAASEPTFTPAPAPSPLVLARAEPGAPLSSDLLDMLYAQSPLGLVLCRRDGSLVRANPAFLRLAGHTAESLQAAGYASLVPADASPEFLAAEAALFEQGSYTHCEAELLNRDGMRVPVRMSGVRTKGPGGEMLAWRIAEDLTVRRRMVEALKRSESEARMLSAVASHTRNMVVIVDRDGGIEWTNQAFEQLSGYTRRELAGRRPGPLLLGLRTERVVIETMRESLAASERFATEISMRTRNGPARWVAVECTPVFDHAGVLERYVLIGRDVTSRRTMHQALAQSEERFRDLTELSSDFFWEQDAQFRFVEMSEIDSGKDTATHNLGETPWANPNSLLGPEAWAKHRQVLASHQPFSEFENAVLTREGKVMWRSISGKPLFASDGTFAGYRGVGRDITARKEADEIIQESKRMYRRVVEGVRDVIFQTDAYGNFIFLNHAWREATGFTIEEAMGEPIYDYLHPDDREAARKLVAAAASGDGDETLDITGRVRCSNGEHRWFEARMQVYADVDGDIVTVGTLHDVTRERAALAQRRKAEAALSAAQDRYQRALDGANDGMWERDLRTGRMFYSTRFFELVGLAEHELSEDSVFFHERVHPEDYPAFKAALEQAMLLRTRGSIEFRVRCGDESYRWFRLRCLVTCDAQGAPMLASGTLTDIHLAKLAEQELTRHRDDLTGLVAERTASAVTAREEAEAALETAEAANRSKSEFLANMSHELRTPMHAILSFAAFGVDKAQFGERAKLLHYFGNIQRSGGRLLSLLNDLLDLSKLEAGKMEMSLRYSAIPDLLHEAVGEAEALAKTREIRLNLDMDDTVPQALLDGTRFLQVVRNLLSNAIKFSPAGGTVTLRLAQAGMPGRAPGLQLQVIDEGIGIPEEELETVFDKFVQSSKTKTGAGGTGLGLAICREIVQAHGGTIEACNNPPPARGACFTVRLPAQGPEGGFAAQVLPRSADIPG